MWKYAYDNGSKELQGANQNKNSKTTRQRHKKSKIHPKMTYSMQK